MCGRVLGADVDNVFIVAEQHCFTFLIIAFGSNLYFAGSVECFFVAHAQRIFFFRVVVLAQRISYPVVTQKQTAHIRMSGKHDAEEVIDFAFRQFGAFPDRSYGRQLGMFAVQCRGRYHQPFTADGRFQMIYHS